jgi:cysteine desulfurase
MEPYWVERFHNPSAPYAAARTVRTDLEDARSRLAHLIGARPSCVTFTAGATESNNLAFATLASADGEVVCDAIEHESVLACAAAHPHTIVGVSSEGLVDPDELARALTPHTELVSIELANGEVGSIQPIREIAQKVRDERMRRLQMGERRDIWLHVDASQAAGTLAVNVSSLGCDLLTLSAAKVYGPKQVGLLWAADGLRLRPLVRGGGQESGLRSGTENVPGVMGFAAAFEEAVAERKQEASRLRALRDQLQRNVTSALPDALVSGPRNSKRRLPAILHLSFPGLDARRLVIALERRGVSVGTGSACAASRMRVSHVLEAMGVPEEAARGSLRISLGRPTTAEDVDYASEQIVQVVREEAAR